MKMICNKQCIIGEGPIWNEKENLLYYTNGFGNEICMLDINTGELKVRPVDEGVAAMAFDVENRLIVSRKDGVFILNEDGSTEALYDTVAFPIIYGNDMKVGPDGRIYVGTLSGKKAGISDQFDGKLYSIDAAGKVRILLEGMIIPNGLDWSMDEKKFYHTDNATGMIREYWFDKEKGDIIFSGREVKVHGVDGFTINKNDHIFAACWGHGHIAVVNTENMEIVDYIKVPTKAPASCCFAGENMNQLAVVTASHEIDIKNDLYAGCTFVKKMDVAGRKPYLFGAIGV